MSVDYYVAVHQANWPTAAALQSCLADRRYPVTLERAPPAPFAVLPEDFGVPVRFQNRKVELETSIVQLSPTASYGYSFARPPDVVIDGPGGRAELHALRPDEVFEGQDINADLASIGTKGVSFGNGDYVLTLSFGAASDEVRAGLYLMAAMIHCFGGYGFEFQGGTHGTEAFADQLVADAADEGSWK